MGRGKAVDPPRTRRRLRRVIRTVLLTLLFLVAAAGSAYGGAYLGVARALPSLDLTSRLASPLTTKIFDASPTPVLLAEIHGLGARDVLPGDQIPQVMRDAIVAAEDPRFYEHKGMDFIAILRAAWANMRHHEVPAGGSAITQALIERAFAGDVEESQNATFQPVLAYELESRWTKEKILNEYLNVTHFGSGAYGLQAAAHSYFGVEAKDLTVAQAALLAGLPGAPATFSPRNDTEGAIVLRSQVLNKLYQQRYITSAQLQEALAAPLGLADGLTDIAAPAPLWVDLVREQLVARYGSSTVLQGGLRVYTSLDLTLQQAAEKAVSAVEGGTAGQAAIAAEAIHGRLSAALVAIDVRTGSLVALVDGDGSAEQTNLATRRRSPAGTAFSPFVLAAAAERGISPQATYGPATGSAMTLAEALTHASTESYDGIGVGDRGVRGGEDRRRPGNHQSPERGPLPQRPPARALHGGDSSGDGPGVCDPLHWRGEILAIGHVRSFHQRCLGEHRAGHRQRRPAPRGEWFHPHQSVGSRARRDGDLHPAQWSHERRRPGRRYRAPGGGSGGCL